MLFLRPLLWRASLLLSLVGGLGTAPLAMAEAPAGASMPAQCDNAHFIQDQTSYNSQFAHQHVPYGQHLELPEHICGQVVHVYRARRSRSGWHGYFLMSVGDGAVIRVVSNLDEMRAPSWPWVNVGDKAEVQGRYYYDGAHRQGLDWTHHGTSRHWPWPGFVEINGQRYQ